LAAARHPGRPPQAAFAAAGFLSSIEAFTPWARPGGGPLSCHREASVAGIIGALPQVMTVSAGHHGVQTAGDVRLEAPDE
jgi:hypothetical protein